MEVRYPALNMDEQDMIYNLLYFYVFFFLTEVIPLRYLKIINAIYESLTSDYHFTQKEEKDN